MLDDGITIDGVVTARGFAGVVTSHSVTWHVVSVDGRLYFRGASIWHKSISSTTAASFGQRWVRVRQLGAGFGWAARLADLPHAIVTEVFRDKPGLVNTGVRTVRGVRVVHLADSASQVSQHANLAGEASGDLTLVLDGLREAVAGLVRRPDWSGWVGRLQDTVRQAVARDDDLLRAEADPIHPARIYGELLPRLADDAVVIGDGGDFVSFAGKYVEPKRPGGWLDPGPYGCLGAGLGASIAARLARPSAQVVLLLGDGAAGFSLMDVDTLVRHDLPVVMVMGNNSAWGLEKGPMQMIYGYDVAADLGRQTRYDEVVRALGGAGETITRPDAIGTALRRAFDAGVPYLVNVITDPAVAYPRSTTGV
jgi:acetolactate synthase-1/2/3 large subunit